MEDSNLFKTDKEAMDFVHRVSGGSELLPDLWIKILIEHGLSIRDVERMCRTSVYFSELCQTKNIWERWFRYEFGNEEVDRRIYKIEPYRLTYDQNKHLKLLFFASRIQKSHEGWIFEQTTRNMREEPYIGLSKSTMKFGRIHTTRIALRFNTTVLESHVERASEILRDVQIIFRRSYIGMREKQDDLGTRFLWNVKTLDEDLEIALIYTALYHGLVLRSKTAYLGNEMALCSMNFHLPATVVCGVCRQAAYCSQACADADWAAHKHECLGGK